ncbi:PAAR domain-containing protein [Massilia endophytica]|uniref:PAAR domain-containing protein n=1 Tax=Massilia endophytica TaxID=2899220 RepID=UPI001E3AF83D|nr:PAAR domain-containing protein [Massilia endophytica]UGQ45827.1 PAAR domain-containing protein [Massilia endophytica]
MVSRYHITVGASTTAGGKVISANSFRSINGATVAYAGDQVSCPACNSVGVIQPDGPRLSDVFNGKQVALSDDLCICKCVPPPRLIANQGFSYQTIEANSHTIAAARAAAAETAANLNAAGSSIPTTDAIPLLLLDRDTEQPFKHCRYRLELADKVIDGTTDHHGATRPLTAKERASFIRWYVEETDAA